jgi:tetratricopeptide (TPR) repeat protein
MALLRHLLPLCETLPILFVFALRPDRDSIGWAFKAQTADRYAHRLTDISVQPLSPEASNQLIDSLLTISDLPEPLRANILGKAEGNPFFVEEVIRTLIEAGEVARDDSGSYWIASSDGSDIDIPDNLLGLLTTRIDKLEEGTRRVLQLAALIGRSFFYRVLARVLADLGPSVNGRISVDEAQLNGHLTTLQQADLIREVARIPELEYIFRHALTQEATYRTILHKQRRAYHRLVGEVIEELFADQLDEYAPAMAAHFQEAGDRDRAAHYHARAGDTAFRLYALDEACDHYQKALFLLDQDTADSETLIHIFSRLGRTQELVNDYDAALETYATMARLAEERQDEALQLAALTARAIVHSVFTPVFDQQVGLPLAEEAIVLARKLEDHAAEARVLWSMMLAKGYALSDLRLAPEYGHQALALAREHNLEDLLPFILNDLGRMLGLGGDLPQGIALMAEATPLFEKAGNLPLLQDNLSGIGVLAIFAGDLDQATELTDEALRISQSINNQWGIEANAWIEIMILLEQGQFGQLVHKMEHLLQISESDRQEMQIWPQIGLLYEELGRVEQILPRYQQHLGQINLEREYFKISFLGELTRLLIRTGDIQGAAATLDEIGTTITVDRLRPLSYWYFSAKADLAFAQGDYEKVIALVDGQRPFQAESGQLYAWGELVLFQVRSLLALDPPQPERAREILAETLTEHRKAGFKRVTWKLAAALADLVPAAEAQPLREEARAILAEIAEGIEDNDLRKSFLDQDQVRAIMESSKTT